MITHPSGFAYLKSTPEWESTRIIPLEPWCRVEGTFRVGQTPAANVPIRLEVDRPHSYGKDVPSIFTHHYVTTGPEGRFVFERVIPGSGSIGRRLMLTVEDGATEVTSSCMIPAEFPAGKTVRIDLGGTGRAVVGRLQPPERFAGKVRWNFALVTAMYEEPKPWVSGPYLTATVDRDGRFRIDDVPAGTYSLSVDLRPHEGGHLQDLHFKVPLPEGNLAAQPVDLGLLKLE